MFSGRTVVLVGEWGVCVSSCRSHGACLLHANAPICALDQRGAHSTIQVQVLGQRLLSLMEKITRKGKNSREEGASFFFQSPMQAPKIGGKVNGQWMIDPVD